MSAATVIEAWKRIEKWCRQYHPRLLDVLNSGATKKEVAAVERKIKQRLPEERHPVASDSQRST